MLPSFILYWFHFLFSIYRALVNSMCEILFLCGSNKRAVIATLTILENVVSENSQKDEVTGIWTDILVLVLHFTAALTFFYSVCWLVLFTFSQVFTKAFEGLSIESGSDLQKILRVDTYTSQASALQKLRTTIPVFQSRMGAMLFLISALLSRGLVRLLSWKLGFILF